MISDLNVRIAVSDIEQWGILAILVFVFLLLALGKALFSFLEKSLAGSGRRYLDHVVTAKTIANFSVEYRMRLEVKRIKSLDYLAGVMFDPQTVRSEFNRFFFNPPFEKGPYRSRLGWPIGTKAEARLAEAPRVFTCCEVERNGEKFVQDISLSPLLQEVLADEQFVLHGCKITVDEFQEELPDRLIEENYAMLTDEQKKEVLPEERYNELDEILAVAVLRRRLDFLGRQSNQKHEADMFSIRTEKVGRSVRIRWKLKSHVPEGCELVGFGKTGGFFADQFYMHQNGPMVVQSRQDGEAMEPLQEGQPTFYTFFLASLQPSEDGGRKAYSPLRFRLTVSTKDENEEIESLLKRFEERSKLDPARENMARALKRIGLAIEYEDGLDNMEKTLLQQVKDKKLPPEEEERKIRVVQEIIRQERSH